MPCGYHEAGEDAFKYVCGGFAVIIRYHDFHFSTPIARVYV